MSVQSVTVALLSTSQTGAVSRVKLVSQAVTGPAGAAGSGASLIVQEGDATVVASCTTMDFGAGFDITESPSGEANVALDLTEYAGGALPVTAGGTGATTASGARTALELGTAATTAATAYATAAQGATADTALQPATIGVTVQGYDADLADIAAIADAQGDIIVRGASGWERLAKSATSTDVLTAGASQPTWAAASGGSSDPLDGNVQIANRIFAR